MLMDLMTLSVSIQMVICTFQRTTEMEQLTIRHIYTWTWHGLIRSTGAEQKRIRLADIDGDGRGDYGVVNDDLSINFWRNGWVDDTPKYWQPLGVRSTLTVGVSLDATLDGLRFTDINGDVS